MPKSLGRSVLVSVLLSAALIAVLNIDKLQSVQDDVDTIGVAAGDVEIADPTSPDPQVHCYPVPTADDLDVKTRMDFEARSSAGWVPAPDEADSGEFCLIESEGAVAKRLAEQ